MVDARARKEAACPWILLYAGAAGAVDVGMPGRCSGARTGVGPGQKLAGAGCRGTAVKLEAVRGAGARLEAGGPGSAGSSVVDAQRQRGPKSCRGVEARGRGGKRSVRGVKKPALRRRNGSRGLDLGDRVGRGGADASRRARGSALGNLSPRGTFEAWKAGRRVSEMIRRACYKREWPEGRGRAKMVLEDATRFKKWDKGDSRNEWMRGCANGLPRGVVVVVIPRGCTPVRHCADGQRRPM
ncbi:hypothetical protein C8F04DRAFT_1193121 [Mycena alexandri]|uniref:Uncharacterized protein n=1 Tax=Mycena alexandri TaxID=1745969 RepID=A0AAD6WWL3_9AGAR|nr:hypothetical protein C8F04DRAFT_1193121 [Mycena alexandri]